MIQEGRKDYNVLERNILKNKSLKEEIDKKILDTYTIQYTVFLETVLGIPFPEKELDSYRTKGKTRTSYNNHLYLNTYMY